MNRFEKIIDEYFDWDFFWMPQSSKTDKVEQKGRDFLANYPDLSKKIIVDLKSNFPDIKFSIFSPFPVEDRCICFEVNSSDQGIFVICISVFEYFLVWKLYDGDPYTADTYIESGASKLIDNIYQIAIKPNINAEWLSKDEAFLEVRKLNYAEGPYKEEEEDFDTPIYLANLLTRFR
jgi:hypothetical protein